MFKETLAYFNLQGKKLSQRVSALGSIGRRRVLLSLLALGAVLVPAYFLVFTPFGDSTQNQVIQGDAYTLPPEVAPQDTTRWPVAVMEEPAGEEKEEIEAPVPAKGEKSAEPPLAEMILPVSGQVIAGYGFNYSQVFNDFRFHDGVDLSVQRDMPVAAVLAGKVSTVEYNQLYGYRVTLDHGSGWQTRYANLAKVSVKKGEQVKQGEKLGVIGDPGSAEAHRGTHLHLELLLDKNPVDPRAYLPLAE